MPSEQLPCERYDGRPMPRKCPRCGATARDTCGVRAAEALAAVKGAPNPQPGELAELRAEIARLRGAAERVRQLEEALRGLLESDNHGYVIIPAKMNAALRVVLDPRDTPNATS